MKILATYTFTKLPAQLLTPSLTLQGYVPFSSIEHLNREKLRGHLDSEKQQFASSEAHESINGSVRKAVVVVGASVRAVATSTQTSLQVAVDFMISSYTSP
mmetsp:Transcript_12788/g.24801  ORF Transcript_12788/g.24801 Transcript_12788/m.24801 type:complete len:101 (-) Transcript_12788:774-1076(-)